MKILRGGDSQANEALHSIVARLYRKDIARGYNMNFSYAAAASVMKMSLGTSFVTVLAKALQTQLPPRVSAKISLVDKNKTRLALYKQKPISKKVRSEQKRAFHSVLHDIDKSASNQYADYEGKGQCEMPLLKKTKD